MKTKTSIEKIKSAVSLAEKMVGKNLTLSSLQALLIIATGNSIKIRATNLAVGIEYEIPATIEQEGVILVKADIISNVLNYLQGDTVTLELKGTVLSVTTTHHSASINTIPTTDEFPTLPIIEGESFSIASSILVEGIRSVYFCAATTDIKPEISSIFMYSDDEQLVFVATDSFRLAEKKIKVKNIPEISSILFPYKNIPDILKILDSLSEVKLTFHKNQCSIVGGGIYFTSRLINGAFPDYRQIIPKEEKTKITLMKSELVNSLRLSTIFTDKFSHVSLIIPEDKKSVLISSKNAEVGKSDTTLDAVIQGEPISVSCNLRYVLDMFQSITSDSVSLSFTEATRPIIARGTQDASFLYLLMPTR